MSQIDYLAPSLEDVRSYFARFGVADGVEFVPGFFEDTLEALRGRRWSLIRLDADGYNATRLALDVLYPGLSVGGYLIIDDYFHPHLGVCRQAVNEFREATRSMSQSSGSTGPEPAGVGRPHRARPRMTVDPPTRARARSAGREQPPTEPGIGPTDRELQLQDEVAALVGRVRALEAELDELKRAGLVPRAALAMRRARRGPSEHDRVTGAP